MINENDYVKTTEYYGDDHYEESADPFYDQMIADHKEMSQWYEFDAYQDFTDSTAVYPARLGLEYTALGLASEAGEFAGKVKKAIRDNTYDADAMAAELGDVLWYLARAAAEIDYHLSTIAEMNVEKLKSRKERNVISGSGDTR